MPQLLMYHDLAQYYNDETELSLLASSTGKNKKGFNLMYQNTMQKLPAELFFIKKCINSRAHINTHLSWL